MVQLGNYEENANVVEEFAHIKRQNDLTYVKMSISWAINHIQNSQTALS